MELILTIWIIGIIVAMATAHWGVALTMFLIMLIGHMMP